MTYCPLFVFTGYDTRKKKKKEGKSHYFKQFITSSCTTKYSTQMLNQTGRWKRFLLLESLNKNTPNMKL
jgi:hypothetical protein